jgi:putative endonuclease
MNKRIQGARYEELAGEYLRQQGFRIVCVNFRCRIAEIDLVAREGKYLVFVEVKLRKNGNFAQAMEYVNRRKQDRIRITASIYLSDHPTDLQPRFDVIEIYSPVETAIAAPQIYHLEDAFQ